MSFLKINDPEKRDFIVQEFLKTKGNIQRSNLARRVGELDTQRDLSTFFKPVLGSQKNIIDELKPIRDDIRNIPKAIAYPQFPGIEAPEETTYLGPIAEKYLRKFTSKTDVDKTFGLYDNHGVFYIGNKQADIIGDNIIVGDHEYRGTPGLWELLISKTPDDQIYTGEDFENYAKIMISTNAMRKNHDSSSQNPKASKGLKWKNIVKTIWENKDQYEGSGVAVVIPSDPNALLERLDLLMASKRAGNTGVRNELVSICDELLRQNIIDKDSYKTLMLSI